MRKRHILLSISLLSLFFSACTKGRIDDETPEIEPQDTISADIIHGYFVRELSREDFTHDQFVENRKLYLGIMAGGNEYVDPIVESAASLSKSYLDYAFASEQFSTPDESQWKMRRITYSYRTVRYDGSPCILSAEMWYPYSSSPAFTHTIESVTSFSNIFWAKYNATYFPSIMAGRCYFNSLCITTDYEGMGIDTLHLHLTFAPDVLARQQLDATLAALEFIDMEPDISLADDYWTANIGMSRGGIASLAMARYLDNEAPQEIVDRIRLQGSFCAVAPYVHEPLMDRFLESDSTSFQCIHFIKLLLTEYYTAPDLFEGYDAQDLFSDEFLALKDDEGRSLFDMVYKDVSDHRKLLEKLGTRTSRIINRDMLAPTGGLDKTNPKVKALIKAMERNNAVADWVPKHPVNLGGIRNDESIPAKCTETAYRTLKKAVFNSHSPVRITDTWLPDIVALGLDLGLENHDFGTTIFTCIGIVTLKPWAN